MAAKRAQEISIFLCENCSAVHIGLFRNGKMFAEAIPDNAGAVLNELRLKVVESQMRRDGASKGMH